jgi:hypothetical protein
MRHQTRHGLFRISKIQFFESNSQEALKGAKNTARVKTRAVVLKDFTSVLIKQTLIDLILCQKFVKIFRFSLQFSHLAYVHRLRNDLAVSD